MKGYCGGGSEKWSKRCRLELRFGLWVYHDRVDILPCDGRNRSTIFIFNKSRRAEIATPASPSLAPMCDYASKWPIKFPPPLRNTHNEKKCVGLNSWDHFREAYGALLNKNVDR